MHLALAASLLASLLGPRSAAAYDRQVTLDLGVGWGFTPALEMLPDHGPVGSLATTIGFDDTWALGIHASWGVHPPLTSSTDPTFHVGVVGVEALYYIDILAVVPFFGLGVDVLPTTDETAWALDFAAHARVSLDYLVSRQITVGLDVRPYVLLTALDIDPVYVTVQVRMSALLEY